MSARGRRRWYCGGLHLVMTGDLNGRLCRIVDVPSWRVDVALWWWFQGGRRTMAATPFGLLPAVVVSRSRGI